MQWLLEEMPNAVDPGDPAYLDSLMPWSQSVPAEIRLKPNAAEGAARMADDPIIDIDPSAFRDDEERESSRTFLKADGKSPVAFSFLRGCFDVHDLALQNFIKPYEVLTGETSMVGRAALDDFAPFQQSLQPEHHASRDVVCIPIFHYQRRAKPVGWIGHFEAPVR
mgnify:CR=1 FL=1